MCRIEGCSGRVIGWQLCERHYRRWRRHGDPLGGGPPRMVDEMERFAAHTKPNGACLDWTGPFVCTGRTPPPGYGRFKSSDGRNWLAHRWIYQHERGPIPPGVVIRHSCDRPWCVRLKHLEPGTQADNIHDAINRGRGWWHHQALPAAHAAPVQ